MEVRGYGTAVPIKTTAQSEQQKELAAACSDFTAVFYQMVLQEMDKTIDRSSNTSAESTFFQEFFYDEISKELAKNPDNQLANMLYQELTEKAKK
ncbi:rod-binding protein [Bacillota bacterium LX-D]|nr:rod-binding protein [Bacillota bacterium LX-D]